MADQDEIDDWLDSDSDDGAGGDAGVAPGTPNDSFVADLMTPGTTPESLRKTDAKTDAKTEPAPAAAPEAGGTCEGVSLVDVNDDPCTRSSPTMPECRAPAAAWTRTGPRGGERRGARCVSYFSIEFNRV